MNSCALALLAMFASSILKSRAVNASTPPAVQSTPVCRPQGRAGAAGGGGGGGGLFVDEDDTEEEDGSKEREECPQVADEDGHGGGLQGLGGSVGVRHVPSEEGMREGLEDGGVGQVCEGHSSARNDGSGVLQLLSTV